MIEAEKADFGVRRCARLLEVSRSGYYAERRRQDAAPGPRQQRRAELTMKIATAHAASDGVYGAPRILDDLRDGGEVVSRKTVAKLMRTMGLRESAPARGVR